MAVVVELVEMSVSVGCLCDPPVQGPAQPGLPANRGEEGGAVGGGRD